ncbi:nuclear transport factor 2 family protein [Chromohalobacter beijerinckii]|uniref:Nuclear transport factor 2 family protein n=2 Tax=Chromohalobacter TaxID=42054 RepID=A0A9X2X546_9GAMM|nr:MULTISPECIES: nuclear transport factor 2 family protein [Chromohalobacter]MCK0766010.1 nuclear transport factor 2 family protein [Chromohalobacter beijerinckii]MCK2047292.1 nuclear transport factor 2 family protein [Chromohalobacter moromii]MCT8506870.1 nuclear transport factor 2 family protein [Chromohalobacter moromii]
MRQDPTLEAFCHAFKKLDKTCTRDLQNLYTEDVSFTDPLHHLEGRDVLLRYYAEMLDNVTECRFDTGHCQREGDDACVDWVMYLTHPRLAGGREIEVAGCSRLTFRGERICRQRDYFDAGAMLYEHLPVFGALIRWLKRRVDPASHSR